MDGHRNVVTAGDLAKVAAMLSKQYDIEVRCTGSECWTDGKVINLPALPEDFSDPKVLQMLRYFLDHECSHIVGNTDLSTLDEVKQKMGAKVDGVVRFLEDVRCEQVMKDGWIGCRDNINGGQSTLMQQMDSPDENDDIVKQWAIATVSLDQGLPRPGFVTNDKVWDFAVKTFNRFIPEARKAATTKHVLPTAAQVVKDLEIALEPEPPKMPPPPGGQPGQPGDGKGEGNGGDGSKPDPNAKPGDSSGSGGGNDPGSGGNESGPAPSPDVKEMKTVDDFVRSLEDALKDRQKEAATPESGSQGGNSGPTCIFDASKEITKMINNDPSVKHPDPGKHSNFTAYDEKSQWVIHHVNTYKNRGYRSALREYATQGEVRKFRRDMERRSGVIQDRLRQMLQSEARNWWQAGHISGQPDPAMLTQLALGLSDKVMRRKKVIAAPETAVILLVDNSSSMRGRRKTEAMLAAALFSYTLEICGHPHKVTQFHNDGTVPNWANISSEEQNRIYSSNRDMSDCQYVVIKDWNESFAIQEKHMVANQHFCSGGTPMGPAIRIAHRDLADRNEKRKVLMAFGDGCPNNSPQTKYEFSKLAESGVEHVLIGIGSGGDRLSNLTKKYVHCNTNGLTRTLMEELEHALFKDE